MGFWHSYLVYRASQQRIDEDRETAALLIPLLALAALVLAGLSSFGVV